MNLPNKLTLARVIMIPFVISLIMLSGSLPHIAAYTAAALLFAAVSYTDYLDGKIARKQNLITDFGKFLDPLADKLLVIGTMLATLYKADALKPYIFWTVLIIIFRELSVTGLRLVAVSAHGEVIAANTLGKIKTVTQIISILTVLLEPLIEWCIIRLLGEGNYALSGVYPLSIITLIAAAFFTLWSGAAYVMTYRKYLKQ